MEPVALHALCLTNSPQPDRRLSGAFATERKQRFSRLVLASALNSVGRIVECYWVPRIARERG